MKQKQCPCCGAPQTFFSLKGQRRVLPCKRNSNYVCLHCTACNNQIGSPVHVIVSHLSAIGLLIVSWWISRFLRISLDLWGAYKDVVFDVPIMLIVYLIVSYVIWFLTPLKCTNAEQANSPDAIDLLHLEKSPLFTPIERKFVKQSIKLMTATQIVLMIIVALGILYLWILR